MQKILILILFLSPPLYAQNFFDYPVSYDDIPNEALKGPVHMVTTIRRLHGKLFDQSVEVYDEKGRLTEFLTDYVKAVSVYDASGRVISVNKFRRVGGEPYATDRYKYDDKNRLIEIDFFNPKGDSTGWQKFNYSADKKELEVTWVYLPLPTDPQIPSSWRTILSYDEKGRWTKKTQFLHYVVTVDFEYDKDGAFVKEVHDGYYNAYKYKKYDAHSNWVERIESYHQPDDPSQDERDHMHSYRKITYYRAAKAKQHTTP